MLVRKWYFFGKGRVFAVGTNMNWKRFYRKHMLYVRISKRYAARSFKEGGCECEVDGSIVTPDEFSRVVKSKGKVI